MDQATPTVPDSSASLWYAQAMEQLVGVIQQLSLARDLDTVMRIVRHAARQLAQADGATFVLRDGDRCFYADEDAISPLWKGQRFPMNICISGWAMLNRQPAVIEDIYADARIPADAYRPTFVKSLAMVPIRTVDPVGAIGVYWATRHQPATEEVRVIQALADITAVTMENVRVYAELEERVSQRTSELQAILDNVQAGIVFSVQGLIVRANPKSAEIFALPDAASLLERQTVEVLHTPVLDQARQHLAAGKVFDTETKLLRHDGSEFWARLVAKPMVTQGQPGGEIWVIHDIGEAKAKERALEAMRVAAEEATQFKSEFLATMSHEIRTPLTGMLGMLELLSLSGLAREQRVTLDAAWDSGRGLLRIVNDILDWSKIEEGKLAILPSPTSIPRLLQESVRIYSRIASAKGLLLHEHSDPRLAAAYLVDPLRLSQILNNFVSNAIKFTRQGEIELQAEWLERLQSGDRLRISVKDSGIGIPPEVQAQLFERYHQGSADTARMYGGTGLGLSICRRLADMMDGQIALESEPGKGSVFSVTLILPVSSDLGEGLSSSRPDVEQYAVTPLFSPDEWAPRILAVDDHPINRDLLARQIRLLGLRAETAENGVVALSMWRKGGFSMVITDCHMPEMDGYDLARRIRSEEAAQSRPRTPVIAWTANALVEEAERCHAVGMDDLLVKPADMAQLKRQMEKWLELFKLEPAPVDFDVLGSIVGDRPAQMHLLRDYREHMRADQAALAEMMQRDDRSAVGHCAHRMKGSSRMVGAGSLAQACDAIEQAARDGNMNAARDAMALLEEALARLERFLAESGGNIDTD